MAKIVLLIALVALVQVATALDCYSCDKTTCLEDMSKWLKVFRCGRSATTTSTGACLKQVYTDRTSNKETTVRKCIIAKKKADGTSSYKCSDIEGPTSTCVVCATDYCNSATSVNFSFVTLLGVAAVFLIPKFM